MTIKDIAILFVLFFSGMFNIYLNRKDDNLNSIKDYATCFLYGLTQFPFVIAIVMMGAAIKLDDLFSKIKKGHGEIC